MPRKSAPDRITLSGIKLAPRLGVSREERESPQACGADVTLWGDFEAAAATDDFASAIDYSAVLSRVVEVAHKAEYKLLETLAYRVGRAVLEGFPVHRVNVRVRKRPAALQDAVDCVEVEIEQP